MNLSPLVSSLVTVMRKRLCVLRFFLMLLLLYNNDKGFIMFLVQQRFIAFLFAVLILLLWQHTHAQTTLKSASDTSIKLQQRLKEKEVSQRIEEQHNAPHIQLNKKRPSLSGTTFPEESPCLTITHLELQLAPQVKQDKNTLAQFSFLNSVLNQYTQRCIGLKGVEFIVHQLMLALLNQGYTTSKIVIPKQDLTRHRLVFHLIPGTIGKVHFKNKNESSHWSYAFPIQTGDILNIRDIEQGIEQIKRLSHQDIDIQIVPGDQLGESDLILNALHADKNYIFNLGINNSGEKETGRYLINGQFSYENLFNRYDLLSISASSNANFWEKQYRFNALGLDFSVPHGYWTSGLSLYAQQNKKHSEGNITDLTITNTSHDISLFTQYLLYRNQTQKDTIEVQLGQHRAHSHYHIKSYDEEEKIEDDDSFSTKQKNTISLTLSLQHTYYFGDAQWDWAIYHQISKGKNVVLDAPLGQRSGFTVQSIDSNINIPFQIKQQRFIFLSTFHAQYAAKDLSGDQHISLGSQYTVRGFEMNNEFDDGELLSAERGMYLRNTLYMPIGQTSHTLYTGLDIGRVFIRNDDELKHRGEYLAGAAIGIQGEYHHIDYNIYMGIPLHGPKTFGSKRPSLMFSLSYTH